MKKTIIFFMFISGFIVSVPYLKAQKLSNSEKQQIISQEWKELMGQYTQVVNQKKIHSKIKQQGYNQTRQPITGKNHASMSYYKIKKINLPESAELKKIVYMNVGSAPLRIVLSELATQIGVSIITENGVNSDVNVQGNFNGQSAKNVLDNLCALLNYAWNMRKGKIYISKYGSEMFEISVPYMSTQFDNEISLSANGVNNGNETSPYNTNPNASTSVYNNTTSNGNSGPNSYVRVYTTQMSLYKDLKENLQSLISKKGTFAINKEAGTVFVFDKVRTLHRISKYFKTLNKILSEEIMVKAKVVEITLNKTFQRGVNWNVLTSGSEFQTNFDLISSGPVLLFHSRPALTTGTTTNGMEEIINLLNTQGKTSVLSEPQILVLNNQPAIIQMADIESYVAQSSQYITQTGSQTSITPGEVMNGVNMTLIPKISRRGIFLNIMPSVTMVQQIQTITAGNQTEIQLPQVASRALNTSIRIKNGDILAIGGLIYNQKQISEQGIPFLSKIPVIGRLFKQTLSQKSKDELIIFLTARRIPWNS